MDFAQSAAARVTATGSAAAAMAAAKFKMLRSNTLAAAFGRAEAQQTGPGVGETCSGGGGAPSADLLALRMKDERVVSTLSTVLNRPSSRFELS